MVVTSEKVTFVTTPLRATTTEDRPPET